MAFRQHLPGGSCYHRILIKNTFHYATVTVWVLVYTCAFKDEVPMRAGRRRQAQLHQFCNQVLLNTAALCPRGSRVVRVSPGPQVWAYWLARHSLALSRRRDINHPKTLILLLILHWSRMSSHHCFVFFGISSVLVPSSFRAYGKRTPTRRCGEYELRTSSRGEAQTSGNRLGKRNSETEWEHKQQPGRRRTRNRNARKVLYCFSYPSVGCIQPHQ